MLITVGKEIKLRLHYSNDMTCTLSLLQCVFNLLYFLLKEHLLCYSKVKIIFFVICLYFIRPLMAVHKARTELIMNHFGLHAKGNFLIV